MRGSCSFSFEEGAWIDGTPYRVVRPLGLGGMGEVYEVDHTRTGTRRAIKVLRARADPLGVLAGRLRVEGVAMRAIDHPNVVRVYEVAKLPDDRPYFAMQKLEGRNLRELIRRSAPLAVARAVALVLQALDGLAAAHAQGIIHRDVKPSNLFLTSEGTLKVLDFGIALRLTRARGELLTEPGMVMGTLRYMAPEQLRAGEADARTDVYAAALVLWELIAGQHPFDAMVDASSSVMTRLHRPAPLLGPWAAKPLPCRLEQTLARALAIEPRHRFESAQSFAKALRRDAGVGRVIGAAVPRHTAATSVSLTFTPGGVERCAQQPGEHQQTNAAKRWGINAVRVVFAAHAVGVVLSACAVLLALIAALAATRHPVSPSAPNAGAAALPRGCGAIGTASSRAAIGVGARGR